MFEIHIESRHAASWKPSIKLNDLLLLLSELCDYVLGLEPVKSSMRRAILSCRFEVSTAIAMMRLPMNTQLVSVKYCRLILQMMGVKHVVVVIRLLFCANDAENRECDDGEQCRYGKRKQFGYPKEGHPYHYVST